MKKDDFLFVLRKIACEENLRFVKLTAPELINVMHAKYGIDISEQHGYITHRYAIIDTLQHFLFKIKYSEYNV